MHTEEIHYSTDELEMVGHLVFDPAIKNKRPAVLVAHAFEGRNELACQYAHKFASLGYVGFAIDMFGNKIIGKNLDECMGMIMPMFENRDILLKRITKAMETVSQLEIVDPSKIGGIGFCFGGMCMLDLARSGADIKGVVSVHGGLKPPPKTNPIKAKVLALHGFKDPQVPKEQVEALKHELEVAKADWQFHEYSIAKHAFTDPNASKIGGPEMGREYSKIATKRAFDSSVTFFSEVFS